MTASADEYATFYHFSQKLTRKDADLDLEWLAVKRTFMLLEEWFADRRLYHLVGYLIWTGEDVNALCALAAGATKQQFRKNLKAKIFESAFRTTEPAPLTTEWIADQLDLLDYGPGSARIRDPSRLLSTMSKFTQ
jgi:hypothetical protein